MMRRDALKRARELLTENNIEEAGWEAEILLRNALKIGRPDLYAHLDRMLTPRQEETFWDSVQRRIDGEPSAYIIGSKEFYGLDFMLGGVVLIPRPETEILVERTIGIARGMPHPTIADVGTGSGAIAVSVAVNVPMARVFAIDFSEAALEIAAENCKRHQVDDRIVLLHGELLRLLPEPVDIIVANLPYVKTAELSTVNTSGFEPRLALDGGQGGLDIIQRLCHEAGEKLKPGGTLLLEVGMGQAEAVTQLLHRIFPGAEVLVIPDWNKIDRIVTMTLPL